MDKRIIDGRIVWLDWMKVIAIFSIIWGHFFSQGHVYLYVFSVQVFCVISGFLYKKSNSWGVCFKRCFWQLFVPTVIMSVIMQLEAFFRCIVMGQSYDISWPWFFQWLLLGHRWCMGPCWYFYSLMVMRLVMQFLPEKKYIYIILFVLLSVGAIMLHQKGIEVSNANTNVLVCMPFFLIGVLLRPMKNLFSKLHKYYVEVILLAVAIFVVVLCGNFNGYVWMYLCEYGNSFILFIIGGMAGTIMLYVLSLWLGRLPYKNMIMTLSKGSIVIIGLHIVIVRRLMELPNRMWVDDFLLSFSLLLLFIPIIRLVEMFFPILLGKYKK